MDNRFLYQEISQKILKRIEADALKEGDIIPTEKELSELYGVSRNTIRNAVQLLVDGGRLKKIRGYGTVITNKLPKTSIGLIVPDIINTFFTRITRGVEDVAVQQGCSVILCNSDNNTEKERKYLDELKDSVLGFIVAPATGNQNYAHYGELIQKQIPFVFIDRYLPEFNVGYVTCDNERGGYLATKYLLERGHRRIAIIEELDATSIRERERGYRKALVESGLAVDERLIIKTNKTNAEGGYDGIGRLLKAKLLITAVFCSNDFVAKGVYTYLNEHGIKIPDEISVVGFDDDVEIATLLNPPLTTVMQPNYKIGVHAAQMLIGAIKKNEKVLTEEVMQVTFVERASVSNLRSDHSQDDLLAK